MARAAVWMRALSNVCHQMFEALAFDAAEQVLGLHFKVVEADFIFLHAAIAEHFDLAAGHAFGRERVGVVAARFLGQEHGQAGEIVRRRIGPGEQRHHVCAHRVGDPGLVAGDRVISPSASFTARVRREPRSEPVFGSVKTAVGRISPLAIIGSHFSFCSVRAADQDEFGGNLGPGAERAGADIAAGEFFGDDAHRRLAHAEAAEVFRNGQAEHAELCHLVDHVHRDIVVAQVPAMGVRLDTLGGIFGELLAHHAHGFVEAGLLDRVARQGVRQEGSGFGHRGRRLAFGDQLFDRRICEQRFGRVQAAKLVRADGLALVHRNAADDLGAVFAEQDL
jgi:hypothetical protein